MKPAAPVTRMRMAVFSGAWKEKQRVTGHAWLATQRVHASCRRGFSRGFLFHRRSGDGMPPPLLQKAEKLAAEVAPEDVYKQPSTFSRGRARLTSNRTAPGLANARTPSAPSATKRSCATARTTAS